MRPTGERHLGQSDARKRALSCRSRPPARWRRAAATAPKGAAVGEWTLGCGPWRPPVGNADLCALLLRRLGVHERIVWVQATIIRRLRPENRGNGEVP
jgi:hypothetical protein